MSDEPALGDFPFVVPDRERMRGLIDSRQMFTRTVYKVWGTGQAITHHFEFRPQNHFRLSNLWADGEAAVILRSLKIGPEEQFSLPIPLTLVNEGTPRFVVPGTRFDGCEILHTLLQSFGPRGLMFKSCGPRVLIRLEFTGIIKQLVFGGIEAVGA